ncbi:MAG TPA: 3-phosphoglycerate dehydrogenase [Gammaproteobacteria bacterium]|jgi:D-3-phosphoglycerate dehydrogenase|nr:3-phosphoglycerate dehydrogenase [Gammaproteobacteria bacterium]HCY05028.1 3-phosphoglycerate dehydrogenase [Gammaproteobacteria bacterium]|tara:strand:- start:2214 stop:3389 length:1176 start_codon:yes stop_codon:yes gene_type:complete
MYTIKTYNAIAPVGLERFSKDQYTVSADVDSADAVLLRSHKLGVDELSSGLCAIARAGAGTNNVPVQECSKRGIVVFNTPGANANSVKELVLTGLLLASRDVLGGINYVRSLASVQDDAELNKLVEAEKKRFKGRELVGKTLGVVGLGAIGSMVARAGLDLGMNVVGYDPALSVDAAWRIPAEVERMQNLPSLFAQADYVTLHVPLLPATEGMINEESLRAFKPGSVLLNFARQPIVESSALSAALENGQVARYVADFPIPGLLDHDKVMLTPHLGASTDEAEENCAVMAADQLRRFLESGSIVNSVNFPTVVSEAHEGFRLAVSNANVPGMLGQMTAVLAERNINVIDLINKSRDDVAYNLIDLSEAPDQGLIDAIAQIESVINVRVIEN